MNSKVQARLLSAVYSCLRPLARILLRSGIPFKQFEELAKRAYVSEALAQRDSRGRQINASRVAVRTGLSRKEVRRLSIPENWNPEIEDSVTLDEAGPPAKVLHAWHLDPRFISPEGLPLELAFDEGEPTFCDLVHAAGGDVPPGAVRAELKRAGAVSELEDGRLRAVKRYFVPADFDEKAVTVISSILFPNIATIAHNTNPDRTTDGFIHRFAYSNRLNAPSTLMFRKWARAEVTNFVEHVDDWLASHESGEEALEEGQSEQVAGVGVFYYEGPVKGYDEGCEQRSSGENRPETSD